MRRVARTVLRAPYYSQRRFIASAMEPRTLTALVPCATGSEDIETVAVVDVLRRAGVRVCLASVHDTSTVTLARGCVLTADCPISTCGGGWDIICVPGGMPGAAHLRDSPELTRLLLGQKGAGGWIAAVCAAPALVLATHSLLGAGTRATAHANFTAALPCAALPCAVAVDAEQRIITSRGAGTAVEWALTCVAALKGLRLAREIARQMHVDAGDGAAWVGEWKRTGVIEDER